MITLTSQNQDALSNIQTMFKGPVLDR